MKTQRGKRLKKKQSINDIWDNTMMSNIHVIGLPKGEGAHKYLKK